MKKRELGSEKRSSKKLAAAQPGPVVRRDEAPPLADEYARGAHPLPRTVERVPPPDQRNAAAASAARGSSMATAPAFEMRSDETTVQGARIGFERRLRELGRGLLPVFETLDLHGMSIEKARAAVSSFCANARGQVPRTVLVIHGKGIHSPTGHAVLRDEVANWLSTMPLARDVLCFATAQPKHGGAGAMYVLLAARPPGAANTASGPRGKRSRG